MYLSIIWLFNTTYTIIIIFLCIQKKNNNTLVLSPDHVHWCHVFNKSVFYFFEFLTKYVFELNFLT